MIDSTVRGVAFLSFLIIPLLHAGALGAEFDIRQCGAKGDGKTLDTAAIQAAVDAASSAGGGIVKVPAGTYFTGGITLKSNVTLRLEKDAVLLGSTRREDYHGGDNAILGASDAEHLVIEGAGVVNGQATANYGSRWGAPDKPAFRTHMIVLNRCRDVSIRDIKLLYSDSWTLHLRRCENVRIDGIEILDNYKRLNSDGIDPNSCKHVKISNCHIVTGDDSIVLKSTEPFPCEDVEVSNCLLESATAALKLGTESKGDFRNIRFHDCKIVNSPVGVGFYIKDGAVVSDVVCRNIEMELCPPTYHSVVPLFIDIEQRNVDSKIGQVRNVLFSDMKITGGSGLLLQGMPQSLLQNITLRNIALTVKDPDDYAKRKKPVGGTRTTHDQRDTVYARAATWAALANIKGLVVENFSVTAGEDDAKKFPRSAMALFNVEGSQVKNVTRQPEAAQPPVIEMTDCKP